MNIFEKKNEIHSLRCRIWKTEKKIASFHCHHTPTHTKTAVAGNHQPHTTIWNFNATECRTNSKPKICTYVRWMSWCVSVCSQNSNEQGEYWNIFLFFPFYWQLNEQRTQSKKLLGAFLLFEEKIHFFLLLLFFSSRKVVIRGERSFSWKLDAVHHQQQHHVYGWWLMFSIILLCALCMSSYFILVVRLAFLIQCHW